MIPQDESQHRSTKEELLSKTASVYREVAKTVSQLAKLEKKKAELEEAETQPKGYSKESANSSNSFIPSWPQSLFLENRKRAYQGRYILEKLGPKVELPLYNQPSDTGIYHENKLKYSEFKLKLMDHFKIRLKEKNKRESYLNSTYAKLSSEWSRKLEQVESTSEKLTEEAKKRDVFEKIFPEIRKEREHVEKISGIRPGYDLEEIIKGLHEQELEDKKMRSNAIIPPILLDERARKLRITNTNGLIEDPMQEYRDNQVSNVWTDSEKEKFKEKYLQHPKNFGVIKTYLERKSVSDCVQYYYSTKYTQNYRQLLGDNRVPRRRRNQQVNPHTGSTMPVRGDTAEFPIIIPETNGVTTRQQKMKMFNILHRGTASNRRTVLGNLADNTLLA